MQRCDTASQRIPPLLAGVDLCAVHRLPPLACHRVAGDFDALRSSVACTALSVSTFASFAATVVVRQRGQCAVSRCRIASGCVCGASVRAGLGATPDSAVPMARPTLFFDFRSP